MSLFVAGFVGLLIGVVLTVAGLILWGIAAPLKKSGPWVVKTPDGKELQFFSERPAQMAALNLALSNGWRGVHTSGLQIIVKP
jgi:hypothetical protein